MKKMEIDFANRRMASIVVLTGAGISAESGLKTFRDDNGLWENHRVEDVATPEAFLRNPGLVQEFYNQRRRQLLSGAVRPNKAHLALTKLEKKFKERFTLVTQNVDDLHTRAGHAQVIHMHGELLKVKCTVCERVWKIEGTDITTEELCPHCESQGRVRPDIVWFGEMPYHMEKIERALAQCDLFVAIGTSGQVYPASLFVQMAKNLAGALTVELNLESTVGSRWFDYSFQGKAGSLVPELVELLEVSS